MRQFLKVLLRLVALVLSFLISTFAAALFFSACVFGSQMLSGSPAEISSAVGTTVVIWFTAINSLLGPAIVAFALAEWLRQTSLIFHLLMGGVFALIFVALGAGDAGIYPFDQAEWLIILACGFVGGFAHWVQVGRNSGHWIA